MTHTRTSSDGPGRRTGSTDSEDRDRDREPSEVPQANTPCLRSAYEDSELETVPEDGAALEGIPADMALVAEPRGV